MKFIKNIFSELKKVRWPDKKYMGKYIVATLCSIIMFTLYFSLITVIVAFIKELI